MEKKRYIKIQKNIIVLYSSNKQLLTLIGPLQTRSLIVKVKLHINSFSNGIEISSIPFKYTASKKKNQVLSLQNTTISLIKQLMLETSTTVCSKLKLVGVGYRAISIEGFKNKLLMFKLGYSHSIFFKIPKELKIKSFKFTKLFISGYFYQTTTQIAALIKSYKMPEPYKGKGILYENEKIKLKEGKKV